MALYVVIRRNAWFKQGTYLEKFDQGLQKVRFKHENNKLKIIGHEGLWVPFNEVEPFIYRVQKRGLDKPGLRKYGH